MNGCDDDVDDVVGGGVPVGGMAGMVNNAILIMLDLFINDDLPNYRCKVASFNVLASLHILKPRSSRHKFLANFC